MRGVRNWFYESEIRRVISEEGELTFNELSKKCDMSRSILNTHLKNMYLDGLLRRGRKTDLRYSYYSLTERGLKCLEEDKRIAGAFEIIEALRANDEKL